jgi:class 3 adenylate cyclase/predicted ATPase
MEAQDTIRCPSCGHINRPEQRYCAQCGRHLGQACPSCGTLSDPDEKFCGHCGALVTGAAEGERRQLTVLFCDLVGSTAIAGQLDPEDWRDVAAEYQRAAAETVTHFGGHVAKYLGDGLLVYFGYPQAHEDDPERAVRAGLSLIDTMAELNRQLEPAHGLRLAVRVGMHTGQVVVGKGVGGAEEVFGDTPNVAARLQALAEPDSALITEATHRLVAGRFIVEAKGAPPLKGARTPIEVYRVVRPSGVRSGVHATEPRGLTPFVGREAERRLLAERWKQACGGEGQVVLLTGEAGVGKSRLVQRFKEDLGGEPHTWIECGASPYHQHTPFYAVTEMLGQALARRGDGPVEERIARLEQSLAAAGLPPAETLPLVAPLLDLPLPDRYSPLPLTAEAQRKRVFATLVAWLFGLARIQPAVVVLEDLQWGDPSTLELLALLAEQGATAPVLFLYTARLEFRAPWPLLEHHVQVTLGRLGRVHVREMVASIAARAAAAELIEAVITRTDGVPLFVEELTKAMLEAEGSGVAPDRMIPVTLQDSLMARLDRLGPAKEVAQVAAVIGREFSYGLLEVVCPPADGDLQVPLDRLVDAELLYARGVPPNANYVFKHALVQDAAYASLLKSRRRELHRRVAKVLVSRFSEIGEGQPELVAHHHTEAGDFEPAVVAWQRAGERALARSALGEAAAHYASTLAALARLPESAERNQRELHLQIALAGVLVMTKGYAAPETARVTARARELGERLGDPAQLLMVLMARWVVTGTRGHLSAAQALADQVLEAAERDARRPSLVFGHLAQGLTRFYRGDALNARVHLEKAVSLYDPAEAFAGSVDPGVLAWTHAAFATWYLGFADASRARVREGLALARRLGRTQDVAAALCYSLLHHVFSRDPRSVLEQVDELVQVATDHQLPAFLAHGLVMRGWALSEQGQCEEGIAQLRQGIETMRATQHGVALAHALGLLAEAQARSGAISDARAVLEQGLAALSEDWFAKPALLHLRGELLAREGGPEAEASFREAIELARRQGARMYELRATTSLARWLTDGGSVAEARRLLAPLYASFTEGFDTRDLVEAKVLLEQLA